MENHYISRDESRLESIADQILEAFRDKDIELIEEIEYDSKVSILIVDQRLNAIFGRRHLEGEVHKVIQESTTFPLYTKIDKTEPALVYIMEFSSGYIILTNPLIVIQNSLKITNDFHIITAILAIFIGSLFTIIFSKQFTKPIIEISSITQSMANLDFSEKIDYKSENELGILADSINSLSENLEENINHMKEEVQFQKVLTRNISHELKTPVAVIKGYVEGVYYGIAETDEEKEQYYKIIINECDRMSTLISEMLAFSKIVATQFTLSDLTQINSIDIQDEIVMVFSETMERQKIRFNLEVENITFLGDRSTIIRVVSNFVSNAVKYGDNKEITLTITRDNGKIHILVYNTGELIEAGYLSRVFDAFYTLDAARTRERNGHGLGLAIVKSIADLYNGKVEAKNKPDGVEFSFVFPENIT